MSPMLSYYRALCCAPRLLTIYPPAVWAFRDEQLAKLTQAMIDARRAQ